MTGSATKQSSGAVRASFVVQRNGTAELDCFAALAVTKEKRKQNADSRVILPSASRDAARALCLFPSPNVRGRVGSGRARLSAFHHGACCGERTPQLNSRYALPGTWSGRTIPNVRTTWFERPRAVQRLIRKSGCRFSGKIMRQLNGRYPLLPVPVQRASRRPVIVPAGRISPEPPGSGGDEPPPAGTALAPPAGVAGWRPLHERDCLASNVNRDQSQEIVALSATRGEVALTGTKSEHTVFIEWMCDGNRP